MIENEQLLDEIKRDDSVLSELSETAWSALFTTGDANLSGVQCDSQTIWPVWPEGLIPSSVATCQTEEEEEEPCRQ